MAGPLTKPLGAGLRRRSSEQKAEDCRKGGYVTGPKFHRNGLGLFGMTPEAKSEAGRAGGKIGGAKTASIQGALAAAGKIGGKTGGVTQGNRNARSGFLRHIA